MPRNPAWEFDELVLALDLYFRVPRARNAKSDPALAEVSETLRALPLPIDRPDPESFRGVNSVYLKLQNFKAIDPEYTRRGLRGMRAGAQERERALWERYATRQEDLAALAERIRRSVSERAVPETSAEGEEEVVEGRLLYRMHRDRERNPGLVRRKKADALAREGRLACEVCSFDFRDRYGDLGEGYIECHHIVPLHALGERPTTLDELALVCANCHRMLHRSREPLSVEELRAIL